MEEQVKNVIEYLKNQPIKGCITGSVMLPEYHKGSDVDIFTYDEKSFVKLLFAMHHNPMFQILDKLEAWKFEKYITSNDSTFYKFGLITIKFTYNTCIDVNIVLKKKAQDIFSVLSSFDMDIISKGYDIETKQTLDLSQNLPNKQATWNAWNPKFYSSELWDISRILRQLERTIKYYRRGYNTDLVVLKYIELINKLQEYENIFNSEIYEEKVKIAKQNTIIVKQICQTWLDTHEISDLQLEKLKEKLKEITPKNNN